MATWNSRGLRGSTLEDLVNRTNEQYAEKNLALIQKIPTPITPVRMDKENRHITLAYFEQRSTVDYIGAVQGIPVCFDAKECNTDTFPLANIHKHQVKLCKNLKSRMESHLSLFPIHIRINIITLHTGSLSISGTGQRLVEGKASDMTNLILTSF